VNVTVAGVVVPARDEEVTIGQCLMSLQAAAAVVEQPVDLVVVLDDCRDGTARIAEALGIRTVAIAARNVGTARRTGFRDLLTRHDPDHLWLATTDADSAVPLHWLARQFDYSARGAAAVAGTVRVTDWAGRPPALERIYASRYHERTGHRHIHGANLGFAARAYLDVGPIPDVTVAEDVALLARLERAGHPVAWAADLPVMTSARHSVRVRGGFSDYLSRLATLPEPA
jgi:glycosyltransferase involved in cell wall biosynthesis